MLALSMSVIAQTSASSTPTSQAPSAAAKDLKADTEALRRELAERQISRLISEVRAGRKLTADQNTEISALEDRLKAELENSASLERSYDAAVREIASLRKALDFADKAIAAKDETIATLKDQRDEARKKAKSANKRAAIAAVVAAAPVIVKVVRILFHF